MTIIALAIGTSVGAWALCFPDVSTLNGAPMLLIRWNDEVYGLDQEEVLRFVPPPFLLHRPVEYRRFLAAGTNFSTGQLVYNVHNGVVRRAQTLSASGTLSSALETCGWEASRFEGMPDCEIDWRLVAMGADGDWLLDDYAPVERRMQALASILSAVGGRDLLIEKRPVARPAIVLRGKWHFRPADVRPSRAAAICLYTTRSDLEPAAPEPGWLRVAQPLENPRGGRAALFRRIWECTGRYVIDETGGQIPANIQWLDYMPARRLGPTERDKELLLENLARQTSLEYSLEEREVPVWFVIERGSQ